MGSPSLNYPLSKFLRFVPMAYAVAAMSSDLSTKVGAIALDDDLAVRSIGWNGLPRKVAHLPERAVRPAKLTWTSHAEESCIAQAARTGVSLKGCTLIVSSLHPCTTCSRLIIQSGIRRVLAPLVDNERWREESATAKQMLDEAGISIHLYNPETHQEVI